MPEAEDSVAKRASTLIKTIDELLEKPTNGVNTLNTELRSLAVALHRVPKWLARVDAKNKLRNLADMTLIHCETALKALRTIPQNGPELVTKANEVRPQITAALAQLLSFGLAVLEKEEDQIEAMQEKTDALLVAQRTEYDKVIANARAAVETANKAAATAIESAKKVGVTVHMTAFSAAKDSSRRWAYAWAGLASVVALGLLTKIAFDINYGSGPPQPLGPWYVAANLSHYLARALSVSLVSYVLVFCTKNFRAAKHNEMVNAHRAGALATYDTLKSPGGGSSRIDDAITLHVAEAVFSPQPSGYDDKAAPDTHLTELLGMLREARK